LGCSSELEAVTEASTKCFCLHGLRELGGFSCWRFNLSLWSAL